MGLFSTIGNAFVSAEKSTLNFITKESHDFEDWSKGFDKRSHGFSNFIPFYGLAKAEANIFTSIDDESKGKISLGRMFGNFGEDIVEGVVSGYTSATGLSALGGAVKGIGEGGIQALSNIATEQTARTVGQRVATQSADAGLQSAIDSAREQGLRFRKYEVKELPKASFSEKVIDKFSRPFRKTLNKPQQVERIVKNLPKPEFKPKPKMEMKTTEETFNELPDSFKEIFERNITTKSNRTEIGIDKKESFNEDFTDQDFEEFDMTDDELFTKEKSGQKDVPKVEKGMDSKFEEDGNTKRIRNERTERDAFDSYAKELQEYEERQAKELQQRRTNPNWRDISVDRRTPLQKINKFSTVDEIKEASQQNINPQEDLDKAYNLIKQDLPENPAEKLSNKIRSEQGFKYEGDDVSII